MTEPRAPSPRRASASRVRPGPEGQARRPGPAFTPIRLALVAGLVIAVAFVIYGVAIDHTEGTRLGAVVGGLILGGIVLVGLAIVGAVAVIRNGRQGDQAGAFWAALVGGLCAVAAAGCLAGALILLLVSGSAG